MYSNESIKLFLNRCRKRLDQELDPNTNFWAPSEMLEYLNEGMSEVWQAVRETHQNWFVKEMNSTDGMAKIGGRDFDTSNLRIQNGRTRLLLPPDFHELLFIEGFPPETSNTETIDPFFPSVVFEYKNLTQRRFRQDALNNITNNVRRYQYDVVYASTGPYIIFSPPLSLQDSLETRINYIASPAQLGLFDSFEGTGFTTLMVAAVLAYVCYAAVKKEDLVENLTTWLNTWNLKRELAVRAAGPKQTRDEETVEGYLEDEES